MTVGLCIISDGRVDYLQQTVASLEEQVDYPWATQVIVDDSGELYVSLRLKQEFPEFRVLSHPRRSGIAAAVQTGWSAMLDTDVGHVFHVEQDFTFNEPVDIDGLVCFLDDHPHLANVTLKRQPYSPPEVKAGDFMAAMPELYKDEGGYVEWDALFCLNPGLIPRKVLDLGPFTSESEFGKLCTDNGYRFAFYGQTTDPPRVTHIGEFRALDWKP